MDTFFTLLALCAGFHRSPVNSPHKGQWHGTLMFSTVYPKKYAHGFCFAVLCCGYTLTDCPISIRLTSLALWQSNDCPSASKATLMNMDKYFMWIHYERLHNHNKAKHNKTVCIFLGIYCKIFDTQIQPIIDYGSEIFYDRKPKPRLESLQTTYLKRALGVRVQTSNLAILGESGRYPLIARQEKLTLGYWLKLTTVPTPNPLRLVYDELYRLSMAGHTTWCSHVRELLKSIGLSDIWEDQKTLVSAESINQYSKLNLNVIIPETGWKT